MIDSINEHILNVQYFIWGYFKKIDNKKLKNLCEKNYENRLTDDVISGINEDIKITKTKEVDILIKNFQKVIKEKYNKEVKLLGYWSQVHQQNESCGLHHHLNLNNLKESCDLAAVYYVQVPEKSGKLVLNYQTHRYNNFEWNFPPKENKYIIFPAGWDHRVSKNFSKDNRISIAFNFKFLN